MLAIVLLPALARADDEPVFEVLRALRGIDVVESVNTIRYAAKGPHPWLDHASINVAVRDGRAHAVEVKKLTLVSASNGVCAKKPAKADTKTYAVTKHELFNWTDEDPIARGSTLRIPAASKQRYNVKASFAGLLTTTACRLEVELVVDRVRARVELPISIRSYDRIGDEPRIGDE